MSPKVKGLRTAIQSMVGVVVGLAVVVWAVPGVPEAVIQYLTENAIQVALVVGIPSGVVAWLQNTLGK
jgi:hypothetical protein